MCSTTENFELIYTHPEFKVAPDISAMKIVFCKKCGLVQSYDFPADEKILQKINTNLSITYDTGIQRCIQKFDYLQNYLDFKNKQQILFIDYGGGDGKFSKYIETKHIPAVNYDPYGKGIKDKDKLSREIINKDPRILIVSFFHVLEHINDPIAFLKSNIDYFKQFDKEIFFLIECPVIENEIKMICDLTPFFAPFHTVHFSIYTLIKMLDTSGLYLENYFLFPDYNGMLTINSIQSMSKNFSTLKSQNLVEELGKFNEHRKNYEVGISLMSLKLKENLNRFQTVVLFGAGLGLDYFRFHFNELLQNKSVVILDSNILRQNSEVRDPQTFFQKHITEKTYLIPTSYAKSREILSACQQMALDYSLSPELIEYFYFPIVRAY
jgi:hypothetical protein